MGFTQNIVARVSKFFAQDKEQANRTLAKGATNDRFDGSALEVLTTLGYDALGNYLRLENDLLNRFADYEEMDDYGEIATALDIIADDATQPDTSEHRTVWITSKDKTLQQNLDDLINRTLRMDEEIWEIARTLSKYGNDYEEIIANEQGVRGLNYLPPATVRRIEGKKGDLLGFIQDFTGKFDYSNADYQQILAAKFGGVTDTNNALDLDLLQNPVAAFEGWEVAHFRLRGRERRSVYGHSVLEGARWIWKRLMLLEDAALVYRLQRAPERFAFYVDTGDLPPNESLAFVNRVRQNFRKKKFVDPGSGKLNLKFDAIAPDEDFFVPSRKGVDSTRIENLGSPQWQAMDDIEYFRDKLFAAIKVPKAYLGQEQGVARAVLSSEDVRFARTVLRVQRELKNGLRKIIRVHLSAQNIDPYTAEYDIHMTVPSAIFELAQMEVRTARADLAARMRDFVSMHWILTHVFGLSEAEIENIQTQRKEDALRDADTQAEAMQRSQPPMPGGEMPPEAGGEVGTEELPPEEMPPEELPPEGAPEEAPQMLAEPTEPPEVAGPFGPPNPAAAQPTGPYAAPAMFPTVTGPFGSQESGLLQSRNVLTEKLNRQRMRAHRRGIPTRNTISDQELFEGKTRENQQRLEEKLALLLKNDHEMSLRLRELGGLLKDLRGATIRNRR